MPRTGRWHDRGGSGTVVLIEGGRSEPSCRPRCSTCQSHRSSPPRRSVTSGPDLGFSWGVPYRIEKFFFGARSLTVPFSLHHPSRPRPGDELRPE
ncbi:hypothetical protein B005_4946 [Nocardiopsis alba ATCC BAA-2165]|uniref:Uncharacterized protein n=1 Tax=Nocardiopsis alba (strain ATCC BAA-2165 / BE74) TaxID=1205910 RepID=J7LDL1_NOCAA|nr:hypothetical protein B005_4946 [Nocardiopsis alba ATCC BAA-2165]